MKTPKIVQNDSWLAPYADSITKRIEYINKKKKKILGIKKESLIEFANGHFYFGCFKENEKWVIREWMPNAEQVYLLGQFNNWEEQEGFKFTKLKTGVWELQLEGDKIKHKDIYKLKAYWNGGSGERIPAWAKRVVQDEETLIFNAQVWNPGDVYDWQNETPKLKDGVLIYEAHVGMSCEAQQVSSFDDFRVNVLPRIKNLGYNVIQLMAIQEHPYYGSFGYHVSGLFAVSSRFGTPEQLKRLIDEAHGMGIKVIMDIVHSHAVKNEVEGLGLYDGTRHQFFHEGAKGEHPAWDSYCYDYGKQEVMHFLLSNVKFWLDEYKFDGFRFDGVTSMMYFDHGLGKDFTSYDCYFDGGQDIDALTYLALANELIHEIDSNAISVAEEMSGYPGLAAPVADGGLGFDYRLAMGVPDFWIKVLKEQSDENWNMGHIFHELTSKRAEEKTISYAESHDQALVGDKTIAFRLMDKEMYFNMLVTEQNLIIDRGVALHKIIRLITMATNGGGYLNFMGNEFGHPEWIDFPREGNGWSYKYAQRQWSLVDREDLKYKYLNRFDAAAIQLIKDNNLSNIYPINLQIANEGDKVLAFARSEFVFIINFHPTKSYTDYGIELPHGKYKYVMGSDELRFGGFGRIDEGQIYKSQLLDDEGAVHHVKFYLPARSAIIVQKQPVPSVYSRIINYINA